MNNSGFIKQSYNFIKKNIWNILLLILIFIIILIVFTLNNISLNPNKDVKKKLVGQLIVETMENPTQPKNESSSLLNLVSSNICDKHKGETHNLEEKCNTLPESVCKSSGCCVLAVTGNNKKCVAGDKYGPTYLSDENDVDLDTDYYYYKNKCYGVKCQNSDSAKKLIENF